MLAAIFLLKFQCNQIYVYILHVYKARNLMMHWQIVSIILNDYEIDEMINR